MKKLRPREVKSLVPHHTVTCETGLTPQAPGYSASRAQIAAEWEENFPLARDPEDGEGHKEI